MRRASITAYLYDVALCAVAMGCLFASPLGVGAKIGLAAAFLAVVNGITEVGLTLIRSNLGRRVCDAHTKLEEIGEASRSGREFLGRYATYDVAGIVIHNGIVVVTGLIIALALRFL